MRKLRRLPWRLPKPQSATPSAATVPDECIASAPDADNFGNRIQPESGGERRRTREPVLSRYPRRAVDRGNSPYHQRERERERKEDPGQPVAYSGGRYVYGHASTHEPLTAETQSMRHRAHEDEFVPAVIPPNT